MRRGAHVRSRQGKGEVAMKIHALAIAFATAAALAASAPTASAASPEDDYSGSQLWLHYVRVSDPDALARYRDAVTGIVVENVERDSVYRHTPNLHMEPGSNERLASTSLEAARDELVEGL